MERRYLYALAILAVLAVGIVNATVFAYRWIAGTVTVAPPTAARGAACTGFYSSAEQSGIAPEYLPPAGTNFNAPTYGEENIQVTPVHVVCQWDNFKLYEGIIVDIPVTVGSWYIQDFYGFGYNGTQNDPEYPTVYVYFRVDNATYPPNILTEAKLIIYKRTSVVGTLDLRQSGNQIGPISLSPGEGLRLDLKLNATTTGSVTFRVGVYVSQENEQPRP